MKTIYLSVDQTMYDSLTHLAKKERTQIPQYIKELLLSHMLDVSMQEEGDYESDQRE